MLAHYFYYDCVSEGYISFSGSGVPRDFEVDFAFQPVTVHQRATHWTHRGLV